MLLLLLLKSVEFDDDKPSLTSHAYWIFLSGVLLFIFMWEHKLVIFMLSVSLAQLILTSCIYHTICKTAENCSSYKHCRWDYHLIYS